MSRRRDDDGINFLIAVLLGWSPDISFGVHVYFLPKSDRYINWTRTHLLPRGIEDQLQRMGTEGTAALVAFLNSKSPENGNQPVLPKLNRIDVSYNTLGDLGTMILIRAISKRAKVNVTEASLSGNDIGSSCIERIMNIFLCHKLITLKLDNNCIGN